MRLYASGINPGEVTKRSDWMGYGIGYPRVIPHSDSAGTIEGVGEGISGFGSARGCGARRAGGPSALPPRDILGSRA